MPPVEKTLREGFGRVENNNRNKQKALEVWVHVVVSFGFCFAFGSKPINTGIRTKIEAGIHISQMVFSAFGFIGLFSLLFSV